MVNKRFQGYGPTRGHIDQGSAELDGFGAIFRRCSQERALGNSMVQFRGALDGA